jgi:hypothetical protein
MRLPVSVGSGMRLLASSKRDGFEAGHADLDERAG